MSLVVHDEMMRPGHWLSAAYTFFFVPDIAVFVLKRDVKLQPTNQHSLLLLFFRHAPLGVRSAIRRHQPPQRTVLSQVDCFIQCEVVGSQISLDGVRPRDIRGRPGDLFQFSGGGAVSKTLLQQNPPLTGGAG